MRLILALCNNWGDYGGKAQYVSWGKEAGVDLTSEDDFFSDPTLKSYYKAFVEVNFCFAMSSNHWKSIPHIYPAVYEQCN
jgi:endo-1,4-beta-mannosidase